MYAENVDIPLVIENDDVIVDENVEESNNIEDENKIEEMPNNDEGTNEVIAEPDNQSSDLLDKSEEIQIFEINQVHQEIDTSDYGIIRIKDPNNTWKGITIHDRNLWATATWAGIDESRQSFGYYFQWWNNYWFPSDPNAEISTTGTQVDASSYWPNTDNWYYSSDTFIKWNNDWSSVRNDNLRWGTWDSKDGNNRWYPITNAEDRRWPCPENYHIPSIWEWSKLLGLRATEYKNVSLSNDNGLHLFSNDEESVNVFYQRFNIPIARQRDSYGIIDNQNERSLFWSSSTYNSTSALRFYWNVNGVFTNRVNVRSYAFPIRCFYNSYRLPVKITYDINWWYRADEESSENKVITYTKIENDSEYEWDIALWTVRRANNCWEDWNKKCIFGWWYTLTGDEMWTWNISEDITLYAKWLAYDDKDISYSGVNFTIMDRNLGSETSWTGENAYGYYLTWWENDIMCAEWYHIPSTWEWLWIKNLLSGDFNSDSIKDLLNLPFAGKVMNNEVIEAGENGYYLTKNWNEIMYAKISDSDIEIKSLNKWEKISTRCFKDYNTWTIKLYTNGWDSIDDIIAVNRREEWNDLPIPSRLNSNFLWWYNSNEEKIENNVNYKNVEQIQLFAKWECNEWYQEKENICEKIEKKSGWSSGWWGGRSSRSSDDSQNKNDTGEKIPPVFPLTEGGLEHPEWQTWNQQPLSPTSQSSPSLAGQGSPDREQTVTPLIGGYGGARGGSTQNYTQEFIDAYNFAYKNWITSKLSIEDAKMFSPLTRIQMAKMLSNYAINVLWKHPDISKWTIKFDDVSNKLNKKYDNAVNLAYQLGIMWQNIKNNKFRPYDEVTRAEFATALSRLLYWTMDWKWIFKYYDPHINKLYNEWIIDKTNPNIKEKRWYVIIILMRSIG